MSAPPVDSTADPPAQQSSRQAPGAVLILIVGDLIAFVVFAALGRQAHDKDTGLAALGLTLMTALPFALGWFAIAPLLGAFRRALLLDPRKTLLRTELAWLAAWPVALLLRWAFDSHHKIPPTSFAMVSLLANAVLLGGWRVAFAQLRGRMRDAR